ncbi:hypothetical protein PHSC3_000822 [Chlamydiales bacterium STE3]|nr:hypothetical protein PHSC3_000822 [Chlamydiales bacterium STE3]
MVYLTEYWDDEDDEPSNEGIYAEDLDSKKMCWFKKDSSVAHSKIPSLLESEVKIDEEPARQHIYKKALKSKMCQCKQECWDALTDIVHPSYVRKISQILAYAYEQENLVALSVASEFNLDQFNFLAILEKEKVFEEELLEYLDTSPEEPFGENSNKDES